MSGHKIQTVQRVRMPDGHVLTLTRSMQSPGREWVVNGARDAKEAQRHPRLGDLVRRLGAVKIA